MEPSLEQHLHCVTHLRRRYTHTHTHPIGPEADKQHKERGPACLGGRGIGKVKGPGKGFGLQEPINLPSTQQQKPLQTVSGWSLKKVVTGGPYHHLEVSQCLGKKDGVKEREPACPLPPARPQSGAAAMETCNPSCRNVLAEFSLPLHSSTMGISAESAAPLPLPGVRGHWEGDPGDPVGWV